jgi:hypothetical protein
MRLSEDNWLTPRLHPLGFPDAKQTRPAQTTRLQLIIILLLQLHFSDGRIPVATLSGRQMDTEWTLELVTAFLELPTDEFRLNFLFVEFRIERNSYDHDSDSIFFHHLPRRGENRRDEKDLTAPGADPAS